MVLQHQDVGTLQNAQRVDAVLNMLQPHSLMPALKSVMATLHQDTAWLRVRAPLVAMTTEAHGALAQQVRALALDPQQH